MPENKPLLPPRYSFMGCPVNQVDTQRLVSCILDHVAANAPLTISYLNPQAVNLCRRNPDFAKQLHRFDIVYCDGFGVKWCAERSGLPTLKRITGPDWTPALFRSLAESDEGVFFLGDEEEVVRKAAQIATNQFPGLRISSFHHGFFNKEPGNPENKRVVEAISKSGARIICLGMGMPTQETWIMQNRDSFPEVKIFISLGALFGHLSGKAYRAPKWATDHGLEWLTRLLHEPRKYFGRYVVGNVAYLIHWISYLIKGKSKSGSPPRPCD